MIITGVKSEVTTSHLSTVQKARLKPSAHGMRLLSSQLYTLPVRAIVREVCTNAYDANIQNRSKKPFGVMLPTADDATFYVKDSGPGISHERMMNEFLTFFESDKNLSNDQIGGFGLGSKSPYSYTDHFIIVSRHDGWKRSYLAHTNEQDEFVIGHMPGDEPCGDETGIEVCVPVKAHDFEDFKRAVSHYVPHFPNGTFKVYGMAVDVPKYKLTLPSCKLRTGSGVSYIKVGPVPYDVEWNALDGKIPYTELELLKDHPFEIEVPIGSVHIHPSREKLNQSDYTVDVIKDIAMRVLQELREYKLAKVQDAETAWQAIVAYNELNGIFDTGREEKITWRGKEYPTSFNIVDCNIVDRSDLGDRAPVLNLVAKGYVQPAEDVRVVIHDMLDEKREKVRIKRRMLTAFHEFPEARRFVLLKDVSQLGDIPLELVTLLSQHAIPKPAPKPPKERVKLRVYSFHFRNFKFILERSIKNSDDLNELLVRDKKFCWAPMKMNVCVEPKLNEYMALPSFRNTIVTLGFSSAVQRAVDLDTIPSVQAMYESRVNQLVHDEELIDLAVQHIVMNGMNSFRSHHRGNAYTTTVMDADSIDVDDEGEVKRQALMREAWGDLDNDLHELFYSPMERREDIRLRQTDIEDLFFLLRSNKLPQEIAVRFEGREKPEDRYNKIIAKYPLMGVLNKMHRIDHLDLEDQITLIKAIASNK